MKFCSCPIIPGPVSGPIPLFLGLPYEFIRKNKDPSWVFLRVSRDFNNKKISSWILSLRLHKNIVSMGKSLDLKRKTTPSGLWRGILCVFVWNTSSRYLGLYRKGYDTSPLSIVIPKLVEITDRHHMTVSRKIVNVSTYSFFTHSIYGSPRFSGNRTEQRGI